MSDDVLRASLSMLIQMHDFHGDRAPAAIALVMEDPEQRPWWDVPLDSDAVEARHQAMQLEKGRRGESL